MIHSKEVVIKIKDLFLSMAAGIALLSVNACDYSMNPDGGGGGGTTPWGNPLVSPTSVGVEGTVVLFDEYGRKQVAHGGVRVRVEAHSIDSTITDDQGKWSVTVLRMPRQWFYISYNKTGYGNVERLRSMPGEEFLMERPSFNVTTLAGTFADGYFNFTGTLSAPPRENLERYIWIFTAKDSSKLFSGREWALTEARVSIGTSRESFQVRVPKNLLSKDTLSGYVVHAVAYGTSSAFFYSNGGKRVHDGFNGEGLSRVFTHLSPTPSNPVRIVVK